MYSLSKLFHNQLLHWLNLIHYFSRLLLIPLVLVGLVNCTSENTSSPEPVNITIPPTNHPEQPTKLPDRETKMTPSPTQTIDQKETVLLDKAIIVVDISEQKLFLYQGEQAIEDNLIKSYSISTSKYGIGNQAGSNKTPLGLHQIQEKIGENAPLGMIFKARQNTGQIAKMNQEGAGDLVTTRIMWLKGLEPGKNAGLGIDSYQRYIYIHGTPEENKIGKPASHGCVRMYNADVIDLFNWVNEGTVVDIRK